MTFLNMDKQIPVSSVQFGRTLVSSFLYTKIQLIREHFIKVQCLDWESRVEIDLKFYKKTPKIMICDKNMRNL